MISYRQHELPRDWDAIVIGSGIGGLAAAACLAKAARKRVLILERHYTAGGFTHSFHRPNYVWDVGVHYVGQAQRESAPVRAALDWLTDGALQWEPMPEVYDRVEIAGSRFEFPSGADRLRERLRRDFPSQANAIGRYLAAVQAAQKAAGLYFAEKAVPRPLARLAGGMMRAPFLRWAGRTTLEVLKEWTQDRELIGVLTAQWPDYGLPPARSSFGIHALVSGHYHDGASYPVGGGSRLAATIAPVIEREGGQVAVAAEVAEVLVERGKAAGVRMADGGEFRAPAVISDAGARNTFERLAPVPEAARTEIRAIPPSCAHLTLYAGLDRDGGELGLNGTNLWIYPGPDHDANLDRFARDPSAPFPVVFLSSPSAKDPEFRRRRPGRSTLEVITVAPYDWFARWEDSRWKRRPAEYDAFKAELAGRLRAELERAFPAVAGHIDHAELSTPLTVRHFTGHAHGESYGLAATPARFRLRGLTPHTPVPGLYLTGQDVASLGVAGALFGGALTASAMLGRNLMSVITRPAGRRTA